MDISFLLFFTLIIFIPHVLGAVAGFGATILAIPLLSLIMPLADAKVYLILYVSISVLWIAIRNYKHIYIREAIKMIGIPILGIPLGIYLFDFLPQQTLMLLLASFVFLTSAWGLLRECGIIKWNFSMPNILLYVLLYIGGIIQGAFASSGPIMVIYAKAKLKDKKSFRATQCIMWVLLNTTIIISFIINKQIDIIFIEWKLFLLGLFLLIIATVIGNIIHNRVNQQVFSKIIYTILLGIAVVIFYNNFT